MVRAEVEKLIIRHEIIHSNSLADCVIIIPRRARPTRSTRDGRTLTDFLLQCIFFFFISPFAPRSTPPDSARGRVQVCVWRRMLSGPAVEHDDRQPRARPQPVCFFVIFF